MAAKDEELEHFYSVEQLNRAFEDSAGRIAAMRLGFKPKKPDPSKVKALLAKGAGKPATFYLSLEGMKKLTFEVRVGTAKIVLNTLDIGGVRDVAKRRELLRELSVRTELVTDKDLAEFDATQADPEDKNEAIELNKQIDRLKNGIDSLQITRNAPNYKHTKFDELGPNMVTEFREWAESKNLGRFIAFLEEAGLGRGLSPKGADLLNDPKTSGIKPATLAAIEAAQAKDDMPDYKQARKEVVVVVNAYILPRFNKEELADIDAQIKDSKQKIETMEKKLKALKAD